MELTQKQELYISRYMRAVADALYGRLNERQCERALSRLQGRVREQINAAGKARPEDIDVLDALRKLGAPERQADILARIWGGESGAAESAASATPAQSSPPEYDAPSPRNTTDAPAKTAMDAPLRKETRPASVWLGVLAWCAEQWDLPVWALRVFVALIGAVTFPAALLVYMAVYFRLRVSGRLGTVPPLRWFQMIFRPALTALMLSVIHFAGVYGVKGVCLAYDTWLKRDMPDISEWAWFETEAGRMFFWALTLLVPLSLFSAMPLANAWDYSIKRFTQACVALYAIVVSFGIASYVTGIILAFVREFTGG